MWFVDDEQDLASVPHQRRRLIRPLAERSGIDGCAHHPLDRTDGRWRRSTRHRRPTQVLLLLLIMRLRRMRTTVLVRHRSSRIGCILLEVLLEVARTESTTQEVHSRREIVTEAGVGNLGDWPAIDLESKRWPEAVTGRYPGPLTGS